jgi:tRNA splicing endonuclease
VLRSGVAYGFEYLLYSKGPGEGHAEFGVYLHPTLLFDESIPHVPSLTLTALSRTAEALKKSALLCFVSAAAAASGARDARDEYDPSASAGLAADSAAPHLQVVKVVIML